MAFFSTLATEPPDFRCSCHERETEGAHWKRSPLGEARRMAKNKLSAEALALLYLREKRLWTQDELAQAKGHSSHRVISRYETGALALSHKELHDMAALMGFSRDAVEALLFVHSLVSPPSPPESASPVDLTPEELQRIDRAVLADGWTRATELRARLIEAKKRRKAEEARQEAGELWDRLKPLSSPARRELIGDSPVFWSWALAERLCDESRRKAADNPVEALALAELAIWTAAMTKSGTEAWRARLSGYTLAYKANALRVLSDHAKSDSVFTRAWTLWQTSAGSEPILPEWRMFSLESSLRRDERRFGEALELLDRARSAARGDFLAEAVILLKKEFVLEQIGDLSGALSSLAEATPLAEASGDPHLLFALHFKTANHLCHLERYWEAAERLPQVRELAERLGNELDLVRVLWLSSRVAAGQGKLEEALAGLEQVRSEFSARGIPYEAALSSLDLAVLHLQEGRTGEVKTLAREMAPIFQIRGITREALASVSLFIEAAQKKTATVELASRAILDLRTTQRTAPRPKDGKRSR
jgi:tetratricopeptide (TPR) repeat protein